MNKFWILRWTWLKFLNFFVLQWFFVRLQRVAIAKTNEIIGYDWLLGVVPLTGWWSDYIFLGQK